MNVEINESKIICVGFINIEDVEYPDTSIHAGVPGGAGLYSACAAKIWQSKVILISSVGRNFPNKFIEILAEKKIELDLIRHDDINTMSGITRYFSDGSREYQMFTTIENRIILTPRVVEFEGKLKLDNVDYSVHLSTIPPEYQLEWAHYFRSIGAKYISFDTDISFVIQKRKQIEELLSSVDICFMNFEEGKNFIPGANDVSGIAQGISQYGCSIIVIKNGDKGAYIYHNSRDQELIVPAFPTDVIDVTGAGDSFAGTFLSILSGGGSIELAAKLAAATASSCIEDYGALHLLEKTKEQIIKKYLTLET